MITLFLQLIQMFKHNHKEKTPPLEICDKVQKEFVVVWKKCFTKHEGQAVKQVLKPKRILERPVTLEPITQEKSQHIGIRSHLFYLNLQHCNVLLSFENIQLIIIKRSQSIILIYNIQLKSSVKHDFIYWVFFSSPKFQKFQTFPTKILCFNHHSESDSMFQHSTSFKITCYNTDS